MTILTGVTTIFGLPIATVRWLLSRRNDLKLETIYLLSSPDQGNSITIINSSSVPVLIGHWELVWRKRSFLRPEKRALEEEYDFDGGVLRIDAHSSLVLNFTDRRYFAWGRDQAVKGKLWLKLWVSGRLGFKWLMVYDPKR